MNTNLAQPQLTPVTTLAEALRAVANESGLTFLLEHWDNGLQVFLDATGKHVQQAVEAACTDFGCDRFGWRAFSHSVDVAWTGESGLLHAGKPTGPHEVLFLESDTTRFPGMKRFASALGAPDKPANLRSYGVEAVEVRANEYVGWRFLAIKELTLPATGESQP